MFWTRSTSTTSNVLLFQTQFIDSVTHLWVLLAWNWQKHIWPCPQLHLNLGTFVLLCLQSKGAQAEGLARCHPRPETVQHLTPPPPPHCDDDLGQLPQNPPGKGSQAIRLRRSRHCRNSLNASASTSTDATPQRCPPVAFEGIRRREPCKWPLRQERNWSLVSVRRPRSFTTRHLGEKSVDRYQERHGNTQKACAPYKIRSRLPHVANLTHSPDIVHKGLCNKKKGWIVYVWWYTGTPPTHQWSLPFCHSRSANSGQWVFSNLFPVCICSFEIKHNFTILNRRHICRPFLSTVQSHLTVIISSVGFFPVYFAKKKHPPTPPLFMIDDDIINVISGNDEKKQSSFVTTWTSRCCHWVNYCSYWKVKKNRYCFWCREEWRSVRCWVSIFFIIKFVQILQVDWECRVWNFCALIAVSIIRLFMSAYQHCSSTSFSQVFVLITVENILFMVIKTISVEDWLLTLMCLVRHG